MNWFLPKNTNYHIYTPRGLFGAERGNLIHEAVDICAKHGTYGIAPEDGDVIWHWIERNPLNGKKPEITWPDGSIYFYGQWCSKPYGGLAVLYGKSGAHYLFCHMDHKQIIDIAKYNDIKLFNGLAMVSNQLVKVVHNLYLPLKVKAGDIIAWMGNSGQSSEPHFHIEYWKNHIRLDPLSLWPENKTEFESHYRRS